MSRRRLGLTAAEVANEVIDDYAVPFGSSSGSSSSNESNFPGEPSFASNNHGTTFFTPVHGNSASQPGRNSRVPFDNRELRYSTPASTRQPLHDLGRRSNAPTAALGQPMDLPSLECQQMLENFNALEEICKKTASQQDDFKKTVIEKFDELSQKLTESLAHQPHPEKRKKMETPCELSKRLKNLTNTDESLAFRAMNGWNVNHNKQVREKLAEQLKMKFGDKYTEEEFEFAIRRKYENERIKARETRNSDLRRKNKNQRKANSSRWHTMKRRSRVLESEEERIMWGKVRPELMSDEEEENGVIQLKTPQWRAEPLNDLIKTLDERLKERGVFERFSKERLRGPSSLREKPSRKYDTTLVI